MDHLLDLKISIMMFSLVDFLDNVVCENKCRLLLIFTWDYRLFRTTLTQPH